MAAPPPQIVIPPKTGKTPKAPPSSGTSIQAIVKYAPAWQPYIGLVKNAARRWGSDPAELMALLVFENQQADPQARSGAGALGLAQIVDKAVNRDLNPDAYDTFVHSYGAEIPAGKAADPAFAINYAAWRMAGTRRNYGSLNDWYVANYNPGFTGDSRGGGPLAVFRLSHVPGYQPSIPESPGQTAGKAVDVAGAKADITNQWAVFRGGKVLFKTGGATPPNGVLKHPVNGQPLTASDFLTLYSTISDTWQAFTGKRPNYGQAASVIARRWSDYQFKSWLGARPDFVGSPVWKQNAPGYKDVWSQVYGPDSKPDTSAIRYAIVNNLGSSGFANGLRQRPDYVQSSEYKQNYNQLENTFRTIYGNPSEADAPTIAQAALHGYDQNTFAKYLRAQPSYAQSTEGVSRSFALLSQLGLLLGKQAVLTPGKPATAAPSPAGMVGPGIPTDTRAPAATVPEGLNVGGGLAG